MKKYKLIKEYPGSPKLGTIVEKHDPYYHGKKRGFVYTLDYIEKSPEFWEEVIEKDYEILTYYCKSLDSVAESIVFKEPQFGGNSEWNIHSVKRLSDGSVFTIGDNTTSGTIIQIHLDNKKGLWLDFTNPCHSGYGDYKSLQKVKQPLFTTEDGVDIYEGDIYYGVYPKAKEPWKVYKSQTHKSMTLCDSVRRFSKKEKAEEYILMHKPCLSLNDIEIAMDQTNYLISAKLNKFRDFLKSKIQQSV